MRFHLDYFYGNEAGQFRFYRMPKALFDCALSLEAATLYSLMLDRVGLSAQNGWVDSLGRVFIYFVQTDVQKFLRCGHNRATAFMRELERFGLIERKRQGLGKPAIIYVKNFAACGDGKNSPPEAAPKNTAGRKQRAAFSAAQKEAVQTAPSGRSGAPGTGSPDGPERAANDTEKKETNLSDTNRILPQPPHAPRTRSRKPGAEVMDTMRWMREKIQENIDYEGLVSDHPYDRNILNGYVELMTEAACSSRETVRICGQELPTAAVRSRFLKLERDHIEYVRSGLRNTTSAIGNIKAYTLAALYNAPVTMEQSYEALVSRDFRNS